MPFVQAGDVDRGDTIDSSLHPIAIGVVQESSSRTARNARQAVFVIVSEGAGDTRNGASCLVAVGVVGVAVAKGRGHGVGFAAALSVSGGVGVPGIVGDIAY